MSKGLTAKQKSFIEQDEVKTRILLTIYVNNEDETVIRIIENETLTSFEIDDKTYLAAAVKRGSIETKIEGGQEKLNISLSNAAQYYSQLIANEGDVLTNSKCSVDEVIFCTDFAFEKEQSKNILRLEDGFIPVNEQYNSIVGNAINIFEGFINNVQLTISSFSFDVERILGGYSTQSPNTTYDVNCQWQFKDERCQYSGSQTTCDKTLTSCKNRSNITRFGGYPSIPQELIIRS